MNDSTLYKVVIKRMVEIRKWHSQDDSEIIGYNEIESDYHILVVENLYGNRSEEVLKLKLDSMFAYRKELPSGLTYEIISLEEIKLNAVITVSGKII